MLPSGKGIPVKATAQGETNVTARAEIALHRIAEEASRDIAEHASATRVNGAVKNLPDPIVGAIQDDGLRFEPDSVPSEPVGFRIMQHRAAGAHDREEAIAATTCLRSGALAALVPVRMYRHRTRRMVDVQRPGFL